jgi:L-ascorbate 6-phosphate lactonase
VIHSDWDDWLPRRIASADPNGIAVWYLGCNGIVLTDGQTTVFVDPYCGTGDPPRTIRMIPVPFDPVDVSTADAVLATHEHTDHVHGPTQGPLLAETDAEFYGPAASVAVTEDEKWTDTYDLRADQIETVESGEQIDIGTFRVHVRAAEDPDAIEPVAYVVCHPAGTIVHGGDARPHESFADIGSTFDVDVAFLAFGSTGQVLDRESGEPTQTTWYNDEAEVVEAAGQLRAERLVPTHWDMWHGLQADPKALFPHAAGFEYPAMVEPVVIGDRVDVPFSTSKH